MEELIAQVTAKAEKWLGGSFDENTRAEVKALLEKEDKSDLIDAFYKDLEFGTGGLRGIMGAGTNRMNIYTVGMATQGLANYLNINFKDRKQISVIVGHDCRNNGRLFAETVANIFSANGIKVYLFDDLRPTPEVSFAIRYLGCQSGVNVTASHNPREYNGYKAYWEDGAQVLAPHDTAIIDEVAKVKVEDIRFKGNPELIEIIGEKVDKAYLDAVQTVCIDPELVRRNHDLGIVYTPLHGCGRVIIPRSLAQWGFTNVNCVPEQMIPDGNFPTVKSPNPENTEGFALAIEYAKKNGADLVIGTDPDSDRCGAVVRKHADGGNGDDNYVVLSGNQEACLMLDYLINVKKEQGTLAADAAVCRSIVSTTMCDAICAAHDIKCFQVLTGFKFIGEKIKQFEENGDYTFLFGFEEAIGFLAGTYARDKDAVVAAMLLAEVGCYYKSKGMTVYEGLQDLYKKYGYFYEKTESFWFEGYDAQEKMADVMVKLRANPPQSINSPVAETVDYLADVPGFTKSNVLSFTLEDGCTCIVRPSGTEPRVKCYILAKGASAAEAEERCAAMLSFMKDTLK